MRGEFTFCKGRFQLRGDLEGDLRPLACVSGVIPESLPKEHAKACCVGLAPFKPNRQPSFASDGLCVCLRLVTCSGTAGPGATLAFKASTPPAMKAPRQK